MWEDLEGWEGAPHAPQAFHRHLKPHHPSQPPLPAPLIPPDLGFRVWALGFGVLGFEFWVWDSGFLVWDLGFGVWGLLSGFRIEGLGLELRVQY